MTGLRPLADRYLGRSRMVVPELPAGPDLLGRDDRQYGQVVTWWWADDRRLVLPVDTGVLVATDPDEVQRRPLRLRGCSRLLLVEAGAGGQHTVREVHHADLVLNRSAGHGALSRPRAPDPGDPGDLVTPLLGREVAARLVAEDPDEDRTAHGRLLAAAATSTHLVLVVAPRRVLVLRRPAEVTTVEDGAVRLRGADGRVTWVPEDERAHAGRPASLVLSAST